jgi:hypothetical protein
MGRIADHVATMRGCSLAQIVAEIDRMEGEALPKVPIGFEIFWDEYPRKTAKPAAIKAYRAALKRKVTHDTIMTGLRRFVASAPDPQYTPHASTWLNQDRFNDAPVTQNLKGIAGERARLRQEIADGYERDGQANSNSGNDRRLALGRPDHDQGERRRLL